MYKSELTGRTKQERGHGGFLRTREKGSIVGIRASCGSISENLWNIRVAQAAFTRLLVQLEMRRRLEEKPLIGLTSQWRPKVLRHFMHSFSVRGQS